MNLNIELVSLCSEIEILELILRKNSFHFSAFRPMVRQWPQLSGDDWKEILSSDESIIAFFNEPERSGISPQQAAEAWFKQMVPLRESKGKKLVSPACASDPAGEAWIAEFMKRVSSNPPDFLGVHWYGTDGDLAIRYLESMHQKYPRQPIIVSEIASISRDRNDVYVVPPKIDT